MALGPLAGGWIYDASASYVGLYVLSFGFGLVAVLFALTYRPFVAASEPKPALASAS